MAETNETLGQAELWPQTRAQYDAALEGFIEVDKKNRRDDLLTSMYKKSEIVRHAEERIKQGIRFGLFALDLDNFKQVNDSFNHAKGDAVLKRFAKLVDLQFERRTDTLDLVEVEETSVGRTGGDEAVLMVELFEPEEGIDEHRRTATIEEQMTATKKALLYIANQLVSEFPELEPLEFGISIGGVVFDPNNPVDAAALFNQADAIAREEKLRRKNELLREEQKRGLLRIAEIADAIGVEVRNLPANIEAVKASQQKHK